MTYCNNINNTQITFNLVLRIHFKIDTSYGIKIAIDLCTNLKPGVFVAEPKNQNLRHFAEVHLFVTLINNIEINENKCLVVVIEMKYY